MRNQVSARTHNVNDWIQRTSRDINQLIQKKKNIVTVTAAYTAEDGDDVILGNATGAAFTVTLPPAATFEGIEFVIKKIDASANAVTVDGNGAETIDGAATVSLAARWDKVRVLSDGANWQKV